MNRGDAIGTHVPTAIKENNRIRFIFDFRVPLSDDELRSVIAELTRLGATEGKVAAHHHLGFYVDTARVQPVEAYARNLGLDLKYTTDWPPR